MAIHPWSRVDDGIFHHFHVRWIGIIGSLLNDGLLPRPYYAIAEPMFGELGPNEPRSLHAVIRSDSTEMAVALAPGEVRLEEFSPDPYQRKTRWILIKDAWQGDSVVAVIELVSRGNKASRARAEQFVPKCCHS